MNIETDEVATLEGIGDRATKNLQKLDIYTIFDLLLHLPNSYKDRTVVTPINELQPDLEYTVSGRVIGTHLVAGKMPFFVVSLSDDTGMVDAIYFNASKFLMQKLTYAKNLTLCGKISVFNNSCQLVNPEMLEANAHEALSCFYGLTANIKMFNMRKFIATARETLQQQPLEELIPQELCPYQYTLKDALLYVHKPTNVQDLETLNSTVHPAQQRIILEELVAHQLGMLLYKKNMHSSNCVQLPPTPALIDKFLASLPFKPTKAQLNTYQQISEDMNHNYPMNRLVQGDVGSGKTLVAILATLQAIGNGAQVAVLAPTEILAVQHYNNFKTKLAPFEFQVGILKGKMTAKERRETLAKIANGEYSVIIGTHAIFQKDVVYKNLNLFIIDEQHRFGVEQRLKLKEKATNDSRTPHQLTMTATPIPRTLAQVMYADMDVSIIDELPPGRTPITTFTLSQENKQKLLARILANSHKKSQVYWVCPLIEETEKLDIQNAVDTAEYLTKNLPTMKIGLIHGRMKSAEKQTIMEAFQAGEIDILVATSVIEVGVDVPNAFLIVIENAERYGLAQLHQLRGRVGRGKLESYCCLLYPSNISHKGMERLSTLCKSNDGLYIAQRDLDFRGPGDLLGTRQTGEIQFKIANMARDQEIINHATSIAKEIIAKHHDLVPKIITRWFPNGDSVSGT